MSYHAEPEPPLEIYPEHEAATLVMSHMRTQINVAGMGGVLGYRYESLPFVFRMVGIARADQAQVYSDLRVIESEMVRAMNERR